MIDSQQITFSAKQNLAQSLIEFPLDVPSHTFECQYHAVPVRFHFESLKFKEELEKFIPTAWKTKNTEDPIEIYFRDPSEFQSLDQFVWDDATDPDCHLKNIDGFEVAIHRDFVGLSLSPTSHIIVTPQKIDDGFFNGLRWILPRHMIKRRRFLLHSSCVVGHDGVARFFLGHSGAGKTTVTRLSGDRIVLGDDMNVLVINEDGEYAEPGLLGQRYPNPSQFGRQFQIDAFYWLRQSHQDSLLSLSQSQASLRLVASCANLFWKQNDSDLLNHLLENASKIVGRHSFYELEFTFSDSFWRLIDG